MNYKLIDGNVSQVNPILLLAGAAAKQKQFMFARDLLECDTGVKSAVELIRISPNLSGMLPTTVAMVCDDMLKRSEEDYALQVWLSR